MCCNCLIETKFPTAGRDPSAKDIILDSSPASWTCHIADALSGCEPKDHHHSFADVICGFVDALNSIVGLASF